jgi:hypothetical protein
MRDEAETTRDARALGLIALLCYSTTLAAMLTSGYALLALTLRAVGRDLASTITAAGM